MNRGPSAYQPKQQRLTARPKGLTEPRGLPVQGRSPAIEPRSRRPPDRWLSSHRQCEAGHAGQDLTTSAKSSCRMGNRFGKRHWRFSRQWQVSDIPSLSARRLAHRYCTLTCPSSSAVRTRFLCSTPPPPFSLSHTQSRARELTHTHE